LLNQILLETEVQVVTLDLELSSPDFDLLQNSERGSVLLELLLRLGEFPLERQQLIKCPVLTE
jgi:hypothetical protein